ncbi:MAG: cytochrome o ubiquinol oxidase subunit IV [Rhizomicrobium sp.]
MTDASFERPDRAPGATEGEEPRAALSGYVTGLAFALLLTLASFWAAGTHLIYGPGVPVLLAVLAIAQMGVHLVFFLHISSAPDHTNNILALAFGILIVALVVIGSLWIMANLNANMLPMDKLMQMQR